MNAAEIVWKGRVELTITDRLAPLAPALDERVQEVWEAELARRPTLTNGTLVAVKSIDGGVVTGEIVEYRVFVARRYDDELRRLIPLRTIGVSGLVSFKGGQVLVGRRHDDVTEYPGAWELVPSGSIDGGSNPVDVLLRELEEEAGLDGSAVTSVTPVGIVHDVRLDGYDICYALSIGGKASDYEFRSEEYVELQALERSDVAALLQGLAVPTSRVLLGLEAAL